MDSAIVMRDPEIMSGALCFAGTRVPVKYLFDYLEGHPTLHTDEGRSRLSPGMCAGFKAGTGNGHGLFSTRTVGLIKCQTLFKYPRTSPKLPRRVNQLS